MAQGEAGGGGAPQAAPSPDGAGPLAGLWSAFLAALVAALLAWLWYGRKGGADEEKKEEEEEKAAATAGPAQSRPAEAEEPFQGSHKCLASETEPNDVSICRESARNLPASLGEHNAPRVTGETPETDPVVKEPVTPLMNCKEYPRNEIFAFPAASEPPQNEGEDKHEERCEEQLLHNSVDPEEWEIVVEQAAWGDATRNMGIEEAGSSRDLEQARRVAAVSPMPQTVHVTFRVHYITYSETRLIAVTGDHECLGQWQHYVPLRCDKDGFWSDSVILPVDTRAEWKFIVVENGKVRRWEECDNRILTTEHEDLLIHKWWGYH